MFGVSRKGKLTGQLVADTTKRDLFEAFQKFEPAADVEVDWVPIDETHQAIVCRVERGNGRPYVYDGKPYKRVQSSTTVMSQEEYEKMLRERGGFRSKWEGVPNPELALADLDAELICETARRAVRCGRLPEETDTDDVEGLLDGFKLRKGGGLARIAAECQRVGLPLPTTTTEHGNVLTVFQRPGWTRTGTVAEISGTANPRTGTMPEITGTRWVVLVSDPVAHLPNLRKDARANAEAVLHEIIADNAATIPEICARTGMALRTINNAITILRMAGIVQSGDFKTGLKEGVKSRANGEDDGVNEGVNEGVNALYEIIVRQPGCRANALAKSAGKSVQTVERYLKVLKDLGKIEFRGAPKTGGYYVR